MDNGNEAHLDVVFSNCNNDFDSFLSTIADYLAKKPNFITFNCKQVSEHFEKVQSTAKNHIANVQLNATAGQSTNGKECSPIELSENDNDSMFGQEDGSDDNVIVPETQLLNESDDDESEIISPVIRTNVKTPNQFNDGSNGSEFAQVHPESQIDNYTEQQSQMVLNLDQGVQDMLREINTTNRRQTQNESVEALTTSTIEADPKCKEKSNELNADNGDSRSTTPDLDFMIGSTRNDGNGTTLQQKDDDETQMFSQNLFDKQTSPQITSHHTSTEDIFAAATQIADFLQPGTIKSSTPRATAKPNTLIINDDDDDDDDDDIFGAATQKGPNMEFLRPAPVNRSIGSIGSTGRSTNKINTSANVEEDLFEAATQKAPNMEFLRPADVNRSKRQSKDKANTTTNDDDAVYDAPTQIVPNDDIFAAATQALQLDEPTVAKKSVTWKPSEQNQNRIQNQKQITNNPNTSDDLFDVETQLIEPEQSNEDLDATEVFNMPTQIMEMPVNPSRRRSPSVLTQGSQPANTPEWSLAARISNAQIERFEQEQEEREERKRREKLRKSKHLFTTSSEDEEEDDLDFDLAKPVPTEIGNRAALTRRPSTETSKRSHIDAEDEGPLSKKKNFKIPKNIIEHRVSVNVSRFEVDEIIRKGMTTEKAMSMRSAREPKINPRAADAKIINIESTRERSLRTRNQEQKKHVPVIEVASRQSKRKQESRAREPSQPREKRPKEMERQKTATIASSKSKDDDAKPRSGRRAKENDKNPPAVITKIAPTNDHSSLAFVKRRNSERTSNRKYIRRAILFTKVNSAPYAKSIQDLGGYVVDTPQLGDVLICDKISRTFKFLYALSKGIPIVTSQWLDMSMKNGAFEPTDPYLVVDKTSEKRFHFSLRNSIDTARQRPLFTNYHIFATPNVQPTTDEISEIVHCSGGKFAISPSDERKPNTKAVLISHKKDNKLWNSYQKCHPDIQIVNCEGFMQSVVQQKINFPDFVLA